MRIEEALAEALSYAESHLALEKSDETFFLNVLLGHYSLKEPFSGSVDDARIANLETPDEIVDAIMEYDVYVRLLSPSEAERDANWVMGLLSPRPSSVEKVFSYLDAISPRKATEYLYNLSVANYYIQKTKVDKNPHWEAVYPDGPSLEVSINLAKPEKNNKDIAKLVGAAKSGYPACLLCKENVGFAGSPTHPSRENIRFVPLTLDGGRWYLQYSPYVYYDRHCIVFYEKHVPMAIDGHILRCLFDFVDQFPDFFIGSNSDLPIVGGSILNHEHFQGGLHEMPLLKAKVRKFIPVEGRSTSLAVLDFYDTVLKVYGRNREEILSIAGQLSSRWRAYDDEKHLIRAKEGLVQHSTVTPIARKVGSTYEMYLILRNNRCNDQYPDGIFHVHSEYQYVKKEGIGLIEAAGLFILPARLIRQGKEAEVCASQGVDEEGSVKEYPDLAGFYPLIRDIRDNGTTLEKHLDGVCRRILENVAVYKDNADGQAALETFVREALK